MTKKRYTPESIFSKLREAEVLQGQAHSTVRYIPQPREDESALRAAMTRLACQYGRYGYRRLHALLSAEGWSVSHSRAVQIWLAHPVGYQHFGDEDHRCELIQISAIASYASRTLIFILKFSRI